jgi:multicomponent Na+:H+ antiporter subunit B
MMEIYLLIMLIFMIVGSIIAIETRNLLSSVISVGIVGFTLSIVFLMLGAPDIAITQVVVEILILVVLIRATVTKDNTAIEKYWDTFSFVSSLIFFGLFLFFAFFAIQEMPDFGDPLMRVSKEYLANAVEKTGATNIVTSVLLDFRAYDTLGEATVLFTSIVGAFVILRRRGRKHKGEEDREKVGILEEKDIEKDFKDF